MDDPLNNLGSIYYHSEPLDSRGPLLHFPNQFLGWDFLTANRLLYKIKVLKPFQNKKGLKNFQVHCFRCFFLQLAAEEDTENGALGKILGTSYIVTALGIISSKVVLASLHILQQSLSSLEIIQD